MNVTGNDENKTFADYGINLEICRALAEDGITHPFLIQALTLPVALTRHDIIGQAKTGTGKTLGFGLPLLEHVVAPDSPDYAEVPLPNCPQALVVLPTRELCKQVGEDLTAAARYLSVRIVSIYGGVAFEPQIKALNAGADVVVGTPGRLLDLERRGVLKLEGVTTVVLDEADEMLDLGFLPDVEAILSKVLPDRHSMLFSATMPGPVIALARRFMRQPTHIRAQVGSDTKSTVATVKQLVYRCHALNKLEVLTRILQAEGRGKAIIFVKTKRTAAHLDAELSSRGFATASLHGDLGQGAREQALRALENGKVDVLVATDVAARGIDVDGVTHVVNYQCPEDDKVYLHRIGRTGRAGASGTAITFVDWEDVPRWKLISNALNLNMPEPVETYHTSDHLYTDLGIPRNVTDRLPRSQRKLPGLQAEKLEDLWGAPGRGDRRGRGGRGGRDRQSGRRGDRQAGRQRSRRGSQAGAQNGGSAEGQRADSGDAQPARRKRKRIRRDRPGGEGTAAEAAS